MKQKIPTFFWIVVSLSVLLVSLSISYYFVSFLPSKESMKQESMNNELTQEEKDTNTRNDCMTEAIQKARDNMQTKYDTGILTKEQMAEWDKVKDSGLAKKDDIDRYFEQCLTIHGLN